MTSLFQILMLVLDVVWFIMIAHIVMSWLITLPAGAVLAAIFFYIFKAIFS